MKKKLAICIPTFNRVEFLKELVESIFRDVRANEVQVCVSDNASEDCTRDFLQSLATKYPNIKYQILESNLGPDRNFFNAVRLADADYCWLMGSDDVLVENAVSFMLSAIEKNPRKIYLSPRINCSFYMIPQDIEHWLDFHQQYYYDFKQVSERALYFRRARNIGAIFSYLSSIIVEKQLWDCCTPPSEFFSTGYPHAYVLLKTAEYSGVQYIDTPIVLNRTGNDHFAKDGWAKRILLDLKGFHMIANDLYLEDAEKIKQIMSVVRRSHPPIKTIGSIASRLNEREWKDAEAILVQCGYPVLMIYVAGLLKTPLHMALKLKHALLK